MMTFTSSVSDLQSLLNKHVDDGDFKNALKVANMLDILYVEELDREGCFAQEKVVFYTLHMALHLLQSDLQGARYLWKRTPANFKLNECSEFVRLWSVVKKLLSGDITDALNVLSVDKSCTYPIVGPNLVDEMKRKIRSQIWSTIIQSYESISLESVSCKLGLNLEDCKEDAISRGCALNDDGMLLMPHSLHKPACHVDNLELINALTDCVSQLEKQPLSLDIKNEVEQLKRMEEKEMEVDGNQYEMLNEAFHRS